MAKFEVHMSTVSSFSVTVEADDTEDAIEKADDLTPSICAQCSGWGKNYGLDLGDTWEPDAVVLDGEDAWVAGENWRRVHEGTDR